LTVNAVDQGVGILAAEQALEHFSSRLLGRVVGVAVAWKLV
jgi:hypothetical protein